MLTKEMVKNSMDAKWRLHQLFIVLAITGITGIVVLLLLGVLEGIVMIGACFGPFILFFLCKYLLLFLCCLGNYEIYEVELNQPRVSSWYRNSVYYMIAIRTEDAQVISTYTNPLWSNPFYSPFQVEDYNNRKVKVALNTKNSKILVLGLYTEFLEERE